MRKYLAVARITFANVLVYRWEYLISQFRAILLLITLYFLWTQVFKTRIILFNFDREQIITYVFLATILRQFVIISATDQIAQELQSWGKFFSYLLKPIGYFSYWFTVDLVYKLTSLVSIILIIIIPTIFFQIPFVQPAGILTFLLFLPATIQSVIKLTPFPYLLYYPISIFLGKLSYIESIRVILISTLWLFAVFSVTKFVWNKGLKAYEAWGG